MVVLRWSPCRRTPRARRIPDLPAPVILRLSPRHELPRHLRLHGFQPPSGLHALSNNPRFQRLCSVKLVTVMVGRVPTMVSVGHLAFSQLLHRFCLFFYFCRPVPHELGYRRHQ